MADTPSALPPLPEPFEIVVNRPFEPWVSSLTKYADRDGRLYTSDQMRAYALAALAAAKPEQAEPHPPDRQCDCAECVSYFGPDADCRTDGDGAIYAAVSRAAPPSRKPLNGDQRARIVEEHATALTYEMVRAVIDATERAHGIGEG